MGGWREGGEREERGEERERWRKESMPRGRVGREGEGERGNTWKRQEGYESVQGR